MQIDGQANINLLGTMGEGGYPAIDRRFPGSFGSAYMYFVIPKVILFRPEHSRRVFVDEVDFISAPGISPPDVCRPGGRSNNRHYIHGGFPPWAVRKGQNAIYNFYFPFSFMFSFILFLFSLLFFFFGFPFLFFFSEPRLASTKCEVFSFLISYYFIFFGIFWLINFWPDHFFVD